MRQVQFKTGDYVRFINEKLEGRISGILAGGRVMVEIEDDFPVEAATSELVLVSVKPQTESETIPKEDVEESTQIPLAELVQSDTVQLLLIPKHGQVNTGPVQLFLANNMHSALCYAVYYKTAGGMSILSSGSLAPGAVLSLDWLERSSWNLKSGLVADILLADAELPLSRRFSSSGIILNQPSLVQTFPALPAPYCYTTSHLLFHTPAVEPSATDQMLIQLKNEFGRGSKSITADDEKDPQPSGSSIQIKSKIEVDLHADAIGSSGQLSNYTGTILEIQLAVFRKHLDKAITTGHPSVVFIHGIGDGILKNSIRKELDQAGFRYIDADQHRYGSGATEVIL